MAWPLGLRVLGLCGRGACRLSVRSQMSITVELEDRNAWDRNRHRDRKFYFFDRFSTISAAACAAACAAAAVGAACATVVAVAAACFRLGSFYNGADSAKRNTGSRMKMLWRCPWAKFGDSWAQWCGSFGGHLSAHASMPWAHGLDIVVTWSPGDVIAGMKESREKGRSRSAARNHPQYRT